MKTIEITIRDIKEIKNLMLEVEKIKEDNYTLNAEGYGYNYSGKEAIIDAKEAFIFKNIQTAAKILGVGYNVIVDMTCDFDFANYVLEDIKANAA